MDDQDTPIALAPLDNVRRQGLACRSVVVWVHDQAGRVYLTKPRSESAPGAERFDVSAAGVVLAGESREEAGLRVLEQSLELPARRLHWLLELNPSQTPDNTFLTMYATPANLDLTLLSAVDPARAWFAEPGEVEFMYDRFRSHLTTRLVDFWEKGVVFAGAQNLY